MKKGFVVTFSGVDGAGKTTILNEIKELIKNEFGKEVVELRQRPSLLPILSAVKYGRKSAEERTMESLPRTGTNSSIISSYIRFLYYLTDYLLGQFFVFFKYTNKGYVIVYDRFYFDYIADPKRANIIINKSFVQFFYRFIIKPDVNIFLYAEPSVILNRKQELDKNTIVKLTNNYKDFFDRKAGKSKEKYLCLENIDKEKTIESIRNALGGYL